MKRTILSLLILILVAMPGIPARAEDPSDATITIQDVITYRNLGESGDMLIIGHYRWTTGNASATPASSAVTIRLVSSNGTTVAAVAPYVYGPFDDDGWGDIVFSFYLTDNATWGESSEIQIVGLPAYFTSPPTLNYTMGAGDYSTENSTEAFQRAVMNTYILNMCDILRAIYPDVELKSISETGMVLSSYGEAYFGSVINELQTLCPALYFLQTYVPEAIAVQAYDMTTGANYTLRLAGTDLMLGFTRVGSYINVSGYVVAGALIFVACIVIIILCMRRGWPLELPLAIDTAVICAGALLFGDLLFTVIMIIGLIAIMGVAYAVVGKRA